MGGAGENKANLDKLADMYRKYIDEREALQAAELDREIVNVDKWLHEQEAALTKAGATDLEWNAMRDLYDVKAADAQMKRQTKITDFYNEEGRKRTEDGIRAEKARIDMVYENEIDSIKARQDAAGAYAKAMGETASDEIRRRASGEREILELRQRQLLTYDTETTSFEEVQKIMEEYWKLQKEITDSKQREVVDLDVRRVEIEREIADLTRQQASLLREQRSARINDTFSALGAGELGSSLDAGMQAAQGLEVGPSLGTDKYSLEYQQWEKYQDMKIEKLIEAGRTEEQLRDEYGQYSLQAEATREQQRMAIVQSGLSAVEGFLAAAQAAAGGKNRALFDAMKATQIASAIISTYSGAAAAVAPPPLGVGPVYGPALAALIIATGMARVAAISSQKFTGGSASLGAGSSVPSLRSGIALPEPIQPEKATAAPVVNVHIYGNVVDHDAFARELIPSINKAVADGVAA